MIMNLINIGVGGCIVGVVIGITLSLRETFDSSDIFVAIMITISGILMTLVNGMRVIGG